MSSTSIARRSKLQREKTIISFGDEFHEDQESGPEISPESTIPTDLIAFTHSYGYNCKKPYNLYLLNEDTLVFLSGNLIHFLNTKTLKVTIRRSVLGQGIGCITRNAHPDFRHLTIGENEIFIYNYPAMELQQRLVGGAKKNYSRVTYSEDGLLLAAHSGEPDFLLTIWKWQFGEILLKLPSHSKAPVFNLKFSSFSSEQLVSSGAGHIKFWTISRQFTGLKCYGSVGRFGSTEISDVYGLYQLEDGKVLSGSDWGNILVWENNSIKYEVFRKNHKTCHQGAITQIICQDQDVLTISADGFMRLWFWETVESTVPADGENFVEVEPILEIKIGGGCQLMSMVKSPVADSQLWYIQDGNGGIWSCDTSNGASGGSTSKQLLKCHAGPIVGVCASPSRDLAATLGEDGRLHLYDYEKKVIIFQKQFKVKGSVILWPSLNVSKSGSTLILGFATGVIRVLVISFKDDNMVGEVHVIQKLKSHTRSISQLSFNGTEEILVSGSEDHSIFVHKVIKGNTIKLIPIGRVSLPSIVTSVGWNGMEFQGSGGNSVALVGCRFGEIFEIELPIEEQNYTDFSYELKEIPMRTMRFKSKKSEIKRLIKVKNYWYKKTFGKKAVEETEDLEDDDNQEDLHFVPPIPNKILWLRAVSRDVLWVCVAQFDSGYIYEYQFGDSVDGECLRVIPVPNCSDLEINVFYQISDEFLFFGLSNGTIRVTKIKDDRTDLSDYWQLGVHDNNDGVLTSIAFTIDKEYLFTSGGDGNLFQYKWNARKGPLESVNNPEELIPIESLSDDDGIGDEEMLSSEEQKRKINDDERHTVCDAEKGKVLDILSKYRSRFQRIWAQNQSLTESQRLDDSVFELDPRITQDLNASLERKTKIAQQEMEYDVERTRLAVKKLKNYFVDPLDSFPIQVLGIRSNDSVQSLKFRKLSPGFYASKEAIQQRMSEFTEEAMERRRQSMSVEFAKQVEKPLVLSTSKDEEFRVHRIESVLREMGNERKFLNLYTKIRRLLKKYKERKAYEQERKLEWESINLQKPNSDINHPDDVQAIQEAEQTIGDYKLKLDEDYVPPEKEHGGESLLMKQQEILQAQQRIYDMKRSYNDEIFSMRKRKELLLKRIKADERQLQRINEELPVNLQRQMIEFKDFNEDLEFPEQFIGIERQIEAGNEGRISQGISRNVYEHFSLLANQDESPTSTESEMRASRIREKTFDRDILLINVEKEIDQFDSDLKCLSEKRLSIEMDTLFLETFLLTLEKDLTIIQSDHEEKAKQAAALVEEKRIENGQYLSKILTQESALESSKKKLEVLKNEKRVLQQTFDSNCLDNKFTDFLKWIFEKTEDDVESLQNDDSNQRSSSLTTTSSGSQQEEYSTVSITSSNYDETFCPRGCDPDLYRLAFDLREKRFELNRKAAEETEVYERVKGDLEFLTKEIREIQIEQRKREDEYLRLRREKQGKLNEIDTLVVLRLDQLQYFKNEQEFEDISGTLLFSRSRLMHLYARVGELSAETQAIKRSHRVNIVFLSRLKSDCHFMEQQMVNLQDQIKDTMMKKFGMQIDLDELQEALLTKLLFEIRLHVDDVVEGECKRKIHDHKRRIAERQVELTKVIQEGTEKLNILTVLHEEKNTLDEILANQIKLRKKVEQRQKDNSSSGRLDFAKDLEGLRTVVRDQDKQIEFLQREIRALKLKTKPFSSVPTLPSLNSQRGGDELQLLKQKKDSAEFESSAFASVINSELSTDRQSTVTVELRSEVGRIIEKFLRKHFQQRLLEKQILRISSKISEYCLRVMESFCELRKEELMPTIVEDVLKTLPGDDASTLVKQSSIVHLFERIHRVYKSKNDIERKDVIWGIVENSAEVALRRDDDDQNSPHEFFVEIWRQLFMTLPIEEIKQKDFLQELLNCLQRLSHSYLRIPRHDIERITGEIAEFVLENCAEEIPVDQIESILSAFFDSVDY